MKKSLVNALLKAEEEKYGIPAFNITGLTQMISVFETAERLRSPVIIQTSVRTAKLFTPQLIVEVFKALLRRFTIPAFLNLDHCRDVDFAIECAVAGYDSVMVDFSKEDFDSNIQKTKRVVKECNKIGGIAVEGEVGIIPGVEDNLKSDKKDERLCTPELALEFIEQTGADIIAPAVGNVHGIDTNVKLDIDIDRVGQIKDILKKNGYNTPIAMHGCSGIPFNILRKLIYKGASKFNVSTDVKLVVSSSIREVICNEDERLNVVKAEEKVKYNLTYKVSEWLEGLVNTQRVNS